MKFLAMSFIFFMTATIHAKTTEGPKYSVLFAEGNIQVRQYESYFTAQTESKGSGFRKLFNYISGANTTKKEISMTAPVLRENSVKINMTSPVTTQSNGDTEIMSFMIPSTFTEETIPTPTDPSVTIVKVPARIVATITYSWMATESRNSKKANELKNWLINDGKYEIVKGPIYAGYDAPFTAPSKKTHEMMFILK